jgi:hypothetical protein
VIAALTNAVVSGVWKLTAILLLLALIITGLFMGAGWYLAARDRDAGKVELAAERTLSAGYRDAIAEQNRAVTALAEQKTAAEARGLAAQQLAAANGKRFDLPLARAAGAKATTCAEAMPTVESVLEVIR